MFKVNNKDTRTTTYFTSCSSVSIDNFAQVNAGWVTILETQKFILETQRFTSTNIAYWSLGNIILVTI